MPWNRGNGQLMSVCDFECDDVDNATNSSHCSLFRPVVRMITG